MEKNADPGYDQVLARVVEIASRQFSEPVHRFDPGTSAADIRDWNSLNHVLFIAEIEKAFQIRFDLLKMTEMTSIGEIVAATLEMIG